MAGSRCPPLLGAVSVASAEAAVAAAIDARHAGWLARIDPWRATPLTPLGAPPPESGPPSLPLLLHPRSPGFPPSSKGGDLQLSVTITPDMWRSWV